MPDPQVSVIIPCHSSQAKFLEECYGSIRSQTAFKQLEVIVVTDDTSIVRGLTIVKDPGYGAWYARNRGIASARAPFIVCLDADDLLLPTYIENALLLAQRSRVRKDGTIRAIVSSNMSEFGLRNGHWDLPPYSQKLLSEQNGLHCASLFSKDLWKLSGGYDQLIGWEDWNFWLKLSKFDPDVTIIPQRLLKYRVHGENSTHSKHHLDEVIRAMIHFKHADITHNFSSRLQSSIFTIMRMDDDALARVDKMLSQIEDGDMRLFSRLAHKYRESLHD